MKSKVPETNRLDRKPRQSSEELEEQTRLRNQVAVDGFNTGMLTPLWHLQINDTLDATQHSETGRCGVTLTLFVLYGL